MIVRRGQFATFGLLVKALTEEPNVRIIWDRRVQERRQQSASNRSRDRRGPDRRDASLLWAHHDYIVIRTRALDPAAGVASLALSRERTLTAVVRQAARELDQDLEIATQTAINLLITGGDPMIRKSLAEQIHRHGTRANSPLTIVDRGLASELFGPEPAGSPSELVGGDLGSVTAFMGRGTWFIEEVGDLTWQQQTGLLHFLERRDQQSSAEASSPSARLITATDYWLFDRVNASRFRPDLFCRLNTVHIVLPAGMVATQRGPAAIEL